MTSPRTTFLIFGGASDLASRLLIPGIADYWSTYPDQEIRVLGIGREAPDDYREFVADAIRNGEAGEVSPDVAEKLADTAIFAVLDATDVDDVTHALTEAHAHGGHVVLYYALAPEVTAESVDVLAQVDLPDNTVLAVEKPLGTDAESAAELEEKLLRVVDEDDLFRVDHFLNETATRNLIGLLESNRIFQAGWSNTDVESIAIVFDESLGLEGRAEFYDSTGAARDMLQSHLLMTLTHILAAGSTAEVNDLFDAMSADLSTARRARYTAGTVAGSQLPDYAEEEGVDPDKETETLAQFSVRVDTERWSGVPMTLRSGKAIGEPLQAITINYRPADTAPASDAPPTRLVIPFDDLVRIDVNITDYADRDNLRPARLTGTLQPSRLTPYARVVRAIVTNDHATEVPPGGAERAWKVIQPVLDAFADGSVPLDEYEAGTHGPSSWWNEM